MHEMLVSLHKVLVQQTREVLFAHGQLGKDARQQRDHVPDGHHEGGIVELLAIVSLCVPS